MKAWLITWEWGNDAAAVADRIAGVLDFRFSNDRIERLVEFLYARETSNVEELAYYARSRRNNPYKAQSDFNSQIMCGHNPYLWARHVKDLKVTRNADGFEEISWCEVPLYRAADEGPVQVRGELLKKSVRQKHGPLSSEPIWDRVTGGFKPSWGPEVS